MPFVPDQPAAGRFVPDAPTAPAAPAAAPVPLTNDNPNPIDNLIIEGLSRYIGKVKDPNLKLGDPQGSVPGRFIQGASEIPIGITQQILQAAGLGDKFNKKISDMRARTEQLRPQGDAGSFDLARLAGNLANPLPYKAAGAFAPAASVAGRIGQQALLGGSIAATSPVMGEGDFDKQKVAQIAAGAVLGGGIPALLAAGGAAKNVVRNVIDPWMGHGGLERAASRTLNTAAGDKHQAVMDALRTYQPLVPGAPVTAAEAAAPAGAPVFSGIERIVAQRPSAANAFEDIGKAAQAARRAEIGTIAGKPGALEQAIRDRAAEANRAYGAIRDVKIDPSALPGARDVASGPFSHFLDKPSVRGAVKRAGVSAHEAGVSFPKSEGEPFTVGNLQRVKEYLDANILAASNASNAGRTPTLSPKELTETKSNLVDWLSKRSPEWQQARENFARSSKEIDRMAVGRELGNKLTNPLGTAETAGQFAGAVRDSTSLIKKAGNPRYEKLADLLTAREMGSVDNVLKSLQRAGENEKLAVTGATAAHDVLGSVVPKAPGLGMFSPQYSVPKAILNRLAGRAEGKSLDVLAQAMKTPEETLRVMQLAGVPKSKIDRIIEARFGQVARNAAIFTTSGDR